jgi:aminocarboxymuconate-semialdehyde decarboxylase
MNVALPSVDIHAHIVPSTALRLLRGAVGRFAPQVATLGGQRFLVLHDGARVPADQGMFEVEGRLEDMDRVGMDVQVLSVVPSLFFYELEPAVALTFAQVFNESIAEVARAWPKRFLSLATVPLQDPPRAAGELDRAVRHLGMHGLEIGTNVAGRNLDDPALEPVWAEASALDVPILVHPQAVAAQEAGSSTASRFDRSPGRRSAGLRASTFPCFTSIASAITCPRWSTC